MPSFKRDRRKLYAVHDVNTGLPIHTCKSEFSVDKKEHLRMVNDKSVWRYEQIDLTRVGPHLKNMFTDGNKLEKVPPALNNLWQECGVYLYDHPTHGQVYLVYNLTHQTSAPLSSTPTQPPQPRTDESLLHPFQ
jgi:hypothetical protein